MRQRKADYRQSKGPSSRLILYGFSDFGRLEFLRSTCCSTTNYAHYKNIELCLSREFLVPRKNEPVLEGFALYANPVKNSVSGVENE